MSDTHIIPDPIRLNARVLAISSMLAQLHSLIQGRGVKPIGSPELAKRAALAQQVWRDTAQSLTEPKLTAYGPVATSNLARHPYESAETIEAWERRVNEIADGAVAEGLAAVALHLPIVHMVPPGGALDALKDQVIEDLGDIAEGVTTNALPALSSLANGMALLALGLAAIFYLGRKA